MLRPLAPSIARDVLAQAADLKKLQKRTASIAEAWARVVPDDLASRTSIERLARGVLVVRLGDASARFELDRFLRAGGLEALRAASHAPIARVKVLAG